MNRVIELVGSFPTVVFTAVLAFCLVWWILSTVLSGGEGGNDGDADFDFDGDGDFGDHHSVGWVFARALRFGRLPLSLSLTIISFVAFAVSGLAQLAAEGNGRLATPAGIAIMVFALAVGGVFHRWVAKAAEPLFVTNIAPDRHAAIGATCRIRTTHVTASLGEAEVTSGSALGQIVRVRTDSGDFTRGDVAHLVGYDQQSGAFTIVELDPDLKSLL
jgi:hypothetical protein